MAITRPAPTTLRYDGPVRALRRWTSALAVATPRTRLTRRRTTLAHPPAPPLPVWRLDRTELTTAVEHSRW